ncbi:MAG TPA: alcohol dehydrogenase catalytic domain-containing protein [Bryobacteraceae bacterium]|nr:alcohol dehydrogenase catalytic domain-containing protein [Bryobacteraceae bacterium]
MSISRRKIFTTGAAAAAGSLAFVPQAIKGQAPAQLTGTNAGRRFKAFVRRGTGASVEELRLKAIQPREVLVRTQASAVCYTIVGGALATTNVARASIPNHSGMGIVEEAGPLVKRVQKGDRVVVPGTPQCGVCYQCLQGRADWCQFLDTGPAHPLAEMSDGTQIFEQAGLGGLSELMVVPEEYCCPVFTDLPAEQLTLLGDTVGTGLAAGRDLVQIEPGWNVVVQGAGPVGMGAIQAARLANAGQVIVIEPIRSRREIAMKVGGTIALDPNAEGNGLVAKIHSLCKGVTDRRFAGGRISGEDGRFVSVPDGADFVINAVGSDWFPPKVEVGPDPTAILPLQQCFDFTRAGGHIVMLGVAWRGNVSFNAANFSNRGRTFYSGQQGGLNMLRDIPRYVRLIEKGVIDMKSMVTATYPIERTREAIQAVGDRTVLGAVITFA